MLINYFLFIQIFGDLGIPEISIKRFKLLAKP
jgi:hypothetical protein